MPWCVRCYEQSGQRDHVKATRLLDGEDLCDPHYTEELHGPGLPRPSVNEFELPLQAPAVATVKHVTVAKPAIELPAPAPDVKEQVKEERNTMSKVCACGCGREVFGTRPYIHGHKPKKPATGEPIKDASGKRTCACGCGTPLVNRHPYIKGHNPAAGAKPAKKKAASKTAVRELMRHSNAIATVQHYVPAQSVSVQVEHKHLDAIWSRLSLQEKVQAVFAPSAIEKAQDGQ